LVLGLDAHDLIHRLPVLEDEEGGDGADAVARRHLLVLVHVELPHLRPALVRGGEGIDGGGDRAAGHAPDGPEIHEHRLLALQDLRLEVRVGEFHHVASGHSRLLLSMGSRILGCAGRGRVSWTGPRSPPCMWPAWYISSAMAARLFLPE